MSLTGRIIRIASGRAARRFDEAARRTAGLQRDLLSRLMATNAETEYGRRCGFADIDDVAAFQRQVPVVTYEDIADDMRRVTEGASGVFTAEDPVMFAQTSGTTGAPKFIPVTPSSQGGSHSDQMRT